jgi:hypothetical protein
VDEATFGFALLPAVGVFIVGLVEPGAFDEVEANATTIATAMRTAAASDVETAFLLPFCLLRARGSEEAMWSSECSDGATVGTETNPEGGLTDCSSCGVVKLASPPVSQTLGVIELGMYRLNGY